jgi:hypothetical protein
MIIIDRDDAINQSAGRTVAANSHFNTRSSDDAHIYYPSSMPFESSVLSLQSMFANSSRIGPVTYFQSLTRNCGVITTRIYTVAEKTTQ